MIHHLIVFLLGVLVGWATGFLVYARLVRAFNERNP